MTATTNRATRKPAIVLCARDHESLSLLADRNVDRSPAVCERLYEELDRARIVPQDKLRADIVRMGTTLSYVSEGAASRTVTLVYPKEADIAAGRISILTPIGVALIGLSEGQSIDWIAPDGSRHRLTLERVLAHGGQPVSPVAEGAETVS